MSNSFINSKIADKLNNETYLQYIKSLVRKYKKIIIVIDGVRYHFEKEHVQKFYEDNKDKIKVMQLPAYSPKLNPIEQTWKKVKNWLATRVWLTKEELQNQLIIALNNPDFKVKIYDYFMR